MRAMLVWVGLLSLLAACGSQSGKGGSPAANTSDYIVTYREDAATLQRLQSLKKGLEAGLSVQSLNQDLSTLGLANTQVRHVYTSALQGVAAKLSAQQVQALGNDSRVVAIEKDQVFTLNTTQSSPPSWGIDRIDQPALPLSQSYTYTNTGRGVNAYIIDTGILPTHSDFGSRARVGVDVMNDGRSGIDCNGHGTHVAGTIGSTTYGVAKQVSLIAVRVFSCSGSTATSNIIAGIDWVRRNAVKPAVVNMSLGGPVSVATDTAVSNAINSGIVFAIAAGNSNTNACNFSPARVPAAITVASSTRTDGRSSFSNFGTCVDLFAPGSSITSTWIGSNTATNTISGTSMASPHAAGVAALYLQTNTTATPVAVRDALVNNATQNVITSPGRGSPNRLLFTNY
jgi:aqualysin 1